MALAALAPRGPLAILAACLGLAICAGSAAYLLDGDTDRIADATPTSRVRRLGWRTLMVPVPAAVAIIGLSTMDHLDPRSHWLRLVPVALGTLAVGVAAASALRRSGSATPGDLAGVLSFTGTVLLLVVDPLRRWLPAAPLGRSPYPDRSLLLWAGIALTSLVVTIACNRDPGRHPHRGRTGRAAPAPGE